jgi:hypothetical protein
MNENVYGRRRLWLHLRYHSVWLEKLEETIKSLSLGNRSPDRNMDPNTPEKRSRNASNPEATFDKCTAEQPNKLLLLSCNNILLYFIIYTQPLSNVQLKTIDLEELRNTVSSCKHILCGRGFRN